MVVGVKENEDIIWGALDVEGARGLVCICWAPHAFGG